MGLLIMKKYKLTNETITFNRKTLFRIKALRKFADVKAGELGGFVEKEDNLSQTGDAWIYDDAIVCGNAKVSDNAYICDNVHVYGCAKVYGYAEINDNARVYGCAKVNDNAHVYDNAQVRGYTEIFGRTRVYNNARVYDNTLACRNTEIAHIDIRNIFDHIINIVHYIYTISQMWHSIFQ